MRTAKDRNDLARVVVVGAVVWASLVGHGSAQPTRERHRCAQAADVDLQQKWSHQARVKFWFSSQGSRIMPYSWFIALEQAQKLDPGEKEELLIESCFMESLGFIVVPGYKLPIGFAQDTNRTGTATYVGLTCAACHTTRLNIGGRTAVVEGGPALVDFSGFLDAVVRSTTATYKDDARFDRWADLVNDTSISRTELRRRLKAKSKELAARSRQNTPTNPYGFGRVDAFGHIFNRVLATAVHADGNAATPDAPVSYPFLWDTPKDMHQKVQWNWSAPNRVFGLLPGDLFRNLGELLGVFGTFDLTQLNTCFPAFDCYKTSSFNRSKLDKLETLVEALRSPVWPREQDGMSIDQALADAGRAIYKGKGTCVECHKLIRRDDPDRRAGDHLVPLASVKTDSAMTDAYNYRLFEQTLQSGLLKGRKIAPTTAGRFQDVTTGDLVLLHVVSGVFLGQGRHDGKAPAEEALVPRAAPDKGYKARSLNGIWATAPYLHNGSVPNLRTLLSKDRGTGFWVGNNTFDPVNVGLSILKGPNASWFDPSKPGNGNQGHPFGVDDLEEQEKRALIEFLKTL
jgi:mono/diheme cytochrome c family protein